MSFSTFFKWAEAKKLSSYSNLIKPALCNQTKPMTIIVVFIIFLLSLSCC